MSEPVEIRVLVDPAVRDAIAKMVEQDPRRFAEKAGEILSTAVPK